LPDLAKISGPPDTDMIKLHSSGKPTTGSKGILLNDLLKSLTTPSKTRRSKKSDNKKPRNTNNDKPAAQAAPKPESCDAIDLGLFKLQNPICSLKNLLGLRPAGTMEDSASVSKPEIAIEGLKILIITP
jgi:hypothetical protein